MLVIWYLLLLLQIQQIPCHPKAGGRCVTGILEGIGRNLARVDTVHRAVVARLRSFMARMNSGINTGCV
jgi:hypothetical protein